MLKTDPIEQTPQYKAIEDELEQAIEDEIGSGSYRGKCHLYWHTKKRILREKYHMEWHSPAELNPRVKFD